MNEQRIYLDHAATSWPKHQRVLDAINDCAQNHSSAGRSAHQSALRANQVVQQARRKLATLIGAESSSDIAFFANGTQALNAAIHGILRPGDHVVTTAAEHNSVLRPIHHLSKTEDIQQTVVPCDSRGNVSASDVLSAVRNDTRLVVMTHASNVTGAVLPIEQVAERLSKTSTLVLVDAAQTVGYLPIDVQTSGIDLLAAPGHKGIGGPLGTGFLYANERVHDQIVPLIFGGTGGNSDSLEMPLQYPAKMEAGNLNVPAIAGLCEAVNMRLESGFASDSLSDSARLARHSAQLCENLAALSGVKLYSNPGDLPIVSLRMEGLGCDDLAAVLDGQFGIETRSGFHCASLIHDFLGTKSGGTLRLSASRETTEQEIETACSALVEIHSQLSLA